MKYDICVLGGCSLDRMFYANEDGTFSDEPNILIPGGKGANQAVAASRAGARVVVVTRLGNDAIGQKILSNLSYNGIYTNNVEMVEGLKNDFSSIYIELKTKDNHIVRETGAIDSFTPDLVEKYSPVILNSKIVIAQMKAPKEFSVALINFCYEHNIPIVITPCRPDKLVISQSGNKELIDKISIITANEKECKTVFECDSVEECVTKYQNKLIVTLGERGVIYHDGEKIVHINAVKVSKLVDTTGAGDTFNGNLVTYLIKGYSLHDSIVRAQYASAYKVQVETAQSGMPYEAELNEFIKKCNCEDGTEKTMENNIEFNVAYDLVLNAYELIRNNSILNIKKKDDNTFVTESDLLIEKLLINEIKKKFPADNFVTEETNSKNEIKDRTWIIDPIDGTIHYMKKSLFWGIQLAFVDKGEIQFSIIYLPKIDELYYAINGKGAFLNNIKILRKKACSINQNILEFCGSFYKQVEQKVILLNGLVNAKNSIANIMHINSCCFAFTNLVSGRTDSLILSTKKSWDILPGILLCREAGFKQFDLFGVDGLKLFTISEEFSNYIQDMIN